MQKSNKKNKTVSQVSDYLREMNIVEWQRHVEEVISSYRTSAGTSTAGIQSDGSVTAPTILTTEDGVPVNTLYVNFARNPVLCQQGGVVRKMFEKFGPVKDIRIITKPNNDRFGFVSYERCEGALRCLLQKKKFPLVYLSVADSWQQDAYKKRPDTDQVESNSTSKEPGLCSVESQPGSEDSSILQLNDDCLTVIFNQLGLMDLIALKNTCSRFAIVACDVLRRYRSFDFTEPRDRPVLTVMDTKNILENVGPFIERLSLSEHRFAHSKTTAAPRILGLIPRNCFHLRELEIHNFDMNPSVLNAMEGIVSSLESLTLNTCAVDDYVERCLSHCQSLKRLQLSGNHTIIGTCLQVIKGLNSLNVENCSQLEGSKLFVFVQNNPQLEYLNITGCPELHTNAINAISRLTELTHLACNDSYSRVTLVNMTMIARIFKIGSLELTITSTPSSDRILRMFAERNCLEYLELKGSLVDRIRYKGILKMTKLKKLKIIGRACFGTFQDEHLDEFCKKTNIETLHILKCPGVSEDKLIEFIERNPQLKMLEIPSVFLTEDFIYSVLDALHRNGSFLEIVVDNEAWRRLQERLKELPTLLKDNRRLLKIKAEIDGDS